MFRSIARRSTASASRRSAGGPQMPFPVIRIAPNLRRCTGISPPSSKIPLSAASRVYVAMGSSFAPPMPASTTLARGGCMRVRALFAVILVAALAAACNRGSTDARDASQPASTSTPPRSRGCDDVPNASDLKKLLQAAPAQNGDAGGLNHGKFMWAAVVNRNGELCALAVSTDDAAATWPGSRGIAIAKASTANGFSSDTAPMSTARLYTLSQPGHSLWGAANGNPLNPLCAGNPIDLATGVGKACGGTITFGGGLGLYKGQTRVG